MKKLINIKSWEEMNESNKSNEPKLYVNPVIKDELIKFIRNNPNGKFKDAHRYIKKMVKGWDLKEEDFDNCKKICDEKK